LGQFALRVGRHRHQKRSPTPAASAAIVLLIAGDWLGDDFGVPGLFWHQNMLKQGLVGFAVTLMFAETCLVSYLLDAPKPWLTGVPEPAPEGWRRIL
jgi:hypothetical protein